ncbi:MAG: hypothetical protein ACRC67_07020 [Inquilinus sp.]|uniref:hypothetical protein n=1 Tax=Inquilinus sp. TaxID=1932117 RepID=UPI003F3C269B
MSQEFNRLGQQELKNDIWSKAKEIAVQNPEIITDVTGIFDPTPISDGISTAAALWKGDWIGAGLSAVSMFPYLGDAIGKTGKFARYGAKGEKIADLVGGLMAKALKGGDAQRQFLQWLSPQKVDELRKQAMAKVREAMLKARKKVPNCKECEEFKGKLQMPKKGEKGKWNTPDGEAPTSGSGKFEFNEPVKLPDGRTVDHIEYRDGFPVFDNYVEGQKHTLDVVTGNVDKDLSQLKRQYPGTDVPDLDDYVLHHFEDGQVGFVPRAVHDKADTGVAHAGGNSIINSDLF